MSKKLLCGILAALMILSAVACAGDGNVAETGVDSDTVAAQPDTELLTEEPAEAPTEEVTEGETVSAFETESATEELTEPATEPETEVSTEEDTESVSDPATETAPEPETAPETEPEPETEPPIELEVPAYEDIGLTTLMAGTDARLNLNYNFADYTYSQLRNDNALVFTANKDYEVDEGGLNLTTEGWNSVGFSHALKEEYTAKTSITNRGSENNVRSIMFGCRVTRSDHLYIDSGLWFTFSENAVYVHVKNGFTKLIRDNYTFNAKDGLNVTIKDDGTTIQCYVNGAVIAKAVVEGETLVVYNTNDAEIARTPDLARIAHGDTLGYVRTMSHFADSTTKSMSLETGTVIPYATDDICAELKEGYTYMLCDKTQVKTGYPITLHDGVTLMDAKAAATLFGFKCAVSEDGTTATLTRDDATLTYTVGSAKVDLNGKAYDCPTTISRGGTILISADYLARWMGYTVTPVDTSVYVTANAEALTEERKQALAERYQLYKDVIYNYDDIEIEQIGVGEYEKTPYEDRLVGIAYSTWLCTKIITWGKNTWDTPLYGNYYSDNREMIAKHAELLRDAGVDFVFVDWTNNTTYDPATMRDSRSDFRMIEEATDLLFEIWSEIEGAPKICIFAGPGHSGIENVQNGKHQKKVDQIYSAYVEKYPDMYFHYLGKPLLMCYGATPNQYGARPNWKDDRFIIRWATGYVGQQSGLYNPKNMSTRNQWWSWEERGLQPYSILNNRVECVTCTAASRPQGSEGDSGYIPAYGRENGLTLKKQFQRANDLGAGMVILISWNEWTKGEQPSPEVSKDLEPSVIHGTFYYDLLCEQIKKFKGQIQIEE
ncbi:MAG: hypothetical protein E7661_05055 [Ruminococcaceae bacterium]|nr:hypothetical protein [Oscillospiraceae bacterium]